MSTYRTQWWGNNPVDIWGQLESEDLFAQEVPETSSFPSAGTPEAFRQGLVDLFVCLRLCIILQRQIRTHTSFTLVNERHTSQSAFGRSTLCAPRSWNKG